MGPCSTLLPAEGVLLTGPLLLAATVNLPPQGLGGNVEPPGGRLGVGQSHLEFPLFSMLRGTPVLQGN